MNKFADTNREGMQLREGKNEETQGTNKIKHKWD
jgi:hypothetical protein